MSVRRGTTRRRRTLLRATLHVNEDAEDGRGDRDRSNADGVRQQRTHPSALVRRRNRRNCYFHRSRSRPAGRRRHRPPTTRSRWTAWGSAIVAHPRAATVVPRRYGSPAERGFRRMAELRLRSRWPLQQQAIHVALRAAEGCESRVGQIRRLRGHRQLLGREPDTDTQDPLERSQRGRHQRHPCGRPHAGVPREVSWSAPRSACRPTSSPAPGWPTPRLPSRSRSNLASSR